MIDNLEIIINDVLGNQLSQTDITSLLNAIKSGKANISASGERSVASQGESSDGIIITGDNNQVYVITGDISESIKNSLKNQQSIAKTNDSFESYTEVFTCCTHFEITIEQIKKLVMYKSLHDLLHKIEFECYIVLVAERRHFPDDEVAIDTLINYEITLKQIIHDGLNIISKSINQKEFSWLKDIERAQALIHAALEYNNKDNLDKAIKKIQRILTIHPSQINAKLNNLAKIINLQQILKKLNNIEKIVKLKSWLTDEKNSDFKYNFDKLFNLETNFIQIVQEHDEWQEIDLEIRRITAIIDCDLEEFKDSWLDLENKCKSKFNNLDGEKSKDLINHCQQLTEAIKKGIEPTIKKRFNLFRRYVNNYFFLLDKNLKYLLEDLEKSSLSIINILYIIQGKFQ